MTVFIDASAMVAILTDEPERDDLLGILADAPRNLYSAMVGWEAATAVARKRTVSQAAALADVTGLAEELGIELVSIGMAEMTTAIDASDRYGKHSGSPAKLNMGDCFAYACARTNGARLLYMGDDFVHTDMAL